MSRAGRAGHHGWPDRRQVPRVLVYPFSRAFMLVLLLVFLVVPPGPGLWGQGRNVHNVRFHHISIAEGLSQSAITCIIQDSQGFMWFGTQDGLNRFDGYHFTVFSHDPFDPGSISDNYIHDVHEDRSGIIWIGTNRGLNRFDPQTGCFARYETGAPDGPPTQGQNEVLAVHEDQLGRLWIGTRGGGLATLDRGSGTFTRFLHDPTDPHSLSDNVVNCIHETPDGLLWIGTKKGGLNVMYSDMGYFSCFTSNPFDERSLDDNSITAITGGRDGTLWIGTGGGQVIRFQPATGGFSRFFPRANDPLRANHNVITTILEDRSGLVWVGSESGGADRFNPASGYYEHFHHEPSNKFSLSHDDVWSIYEDHSGVVWVGTYGGGLNKFNRQTERFAYYRNNPNQNSLGHNDVWCFHQDRAGMLWIGTRNGLNKLDRRNGRFSMYLHDPRNPNSLGGNDIRAIHEDRSGQLWIGTNGGGLNRLDPARRTFTHFRHSARDPLSLAHDQVRTILEDRTGMIWIGTNGGGLSRRDETHGHFHNFAHDPADPASLSHNSVMTLLEDRYGIIWIGTDGGGLNAFNSQKETFSHFKHDASKPESLSNDFVMCLHEDRSGVIWVGTYGGGLNKLDRKRGSFRAYMKKDGLLNEVVYGILDDRQGHLWLSTNRGLFRFNPDSGDFKCYDSDDGLQNSEFNFGAYHQNRQGEMIFGGINGFNIFYPDQILDNPHRPPVALTDLFLFNRRVPPQRKSPNSPLRRSIHTTENLTLTHRHHVFSIEFAALDFANPRKNRYAYKLEGWDENWIETDWQNRRATYTNLPAGRYVLRVRGSNNDALWNRAGASLTINILPAPWRTWWAYGLYTIVGLGILFILFSLWYQKKKIIYEHAMVERLQQVDQLKDEFLSNTSHELRTPLNGIIGLTESLIAGAAGPLTPKLAENLSMVVSSGKRLAQLVNEILDFSRLKHKSLELQKKPVDLRALTDVVLTLSKSLTGKKKIQLINAIEPNLPWVEADEDRLQQILHNLVDNAIKFTNVGSIRVSAVPEGRRLFVRVTDTGIGIPREKADRIFESFEQLEGSTIRTHGGTGLGLTLTRQLVELHNGTIWVESEVGHGSTFTFTLPFSSEDALETTLTTPEPVRPPVPGLINPPKEKGPQSEHQPRPGEPPINPPYDHPNGAPDQKTPGVFHILVVDDDPVSRQVLLNHLSLQKYTVTQTSGGAQALKAIDDTDDFDLVLLDIMMPGMSGYEVCRKIRETYPSHELPIIFLTAKNQVSDLVTGFRAGANDFITKPVQESELLARVKTHLELLEINRHLEQKVKERTHELAHKNRELHTAYKKLEEVSLSDPLTGLRNRRYLQKFIHPDIVKVQRDYENWLRKPSRPEPAPDDMVFLMLDLDHFKNINDTHGHTAGDRVLKQLGYILQKECRKSDILVRWGGEEFLIVSRFNNRERAPMLAERLQRAVEATTFNLPSGQTSRLTCSIGYAGYPFLRNFPGVLKWEQVVDIADQALYAVKKSGRNAWVGISSTDGTNPENLYRRIRDDIGSLIRKGRLTIESSIRDPNALVWD